MYSTCLFCSRPFERNAAVESLQLGRRIAVDAERGRLWVVCRTCERWNLVPLDTRWEIIEETERLFRDTRLRVSTEQVGLARLKEGTELVRIGRPLRPEFAAWRYGDQFGRRRRRTLLVGTGVVAAAGVAVTAGLMAGVVSASLLTQSGHAVNAWFNYRTLVRIRTADGRVIRLRQRHLMNTLISRRLDGSWYVDLDTKDTSGASAFTQDEAQRVAGLLLPRMNAFGASRRQVAAAVAEIERSGSADEYMRRVIAQPPESSWRADTYPKVDGIYPVTLPKAHRLALEMALHEEQERRLLAGELKGLELAWREAEEVAAIADDLLLPPSVRQRLGSAGPNPHSEDAP